MLTQTNIKKLGAYGGATLVGGLLAGPIGLILVPTVLHFGSKFLNPTPPPAPAPHGEEDNG